MIEQLEHVKNPYGLNKKKKNIFDKLFLDLTKFHLKNNENYKKFSNFFSPTINSISDTVPLPVRIFKENNLKTSNIKIIKQLNSSGTSGSKSRIYLDRKNLINQSKVLSKIMANNIGGNRLPMLIVDKKPKSSDILSASSAAINGFSIFGRDHVFLIDEDGKLNLNKLYEFEKKYKNEKKIIFGFTYNIYKYLIEKRYSRKINLNKTVILHGGGWKKLENKKIEKKRFNDLLIKKYNLEKVVNYYGLVEQTGSIFMECKYGYFHCSIYSDIYILDKNFKIKKNGEEGIVQLLSLLPTSYPGHNILTEDLGIIVGENNCKCGRFGKYFKITGRIKKSENRGCSDANL